MVAALVKFRLLHVRRRRRFTAKIAKSAKKFNAGYEDRSTMS
jgi:hypothetical protein